MFEIPLSGSVSPSKTYMIGIYDPNGLNEIHFERVVLPESAPNSIKNAMQYYLLDNIKEATNIHIMACISVEEYLSAAITDRNREDIDLTLKMLHDWNAKQKNPSESYSVALTILLRQVTLMDDFNNRLSKLKEMALALLQIE